MNPSSDPQLTAQSRFSQQSFLVLTGLTEGQEFGCDGQLWQIKQFNGVKFIPKGFHLFTTSTSTSNTSSSSSTTTSNNRTNTTEEEDRREVSGDTGLGIRHAVLKYFDQPGGETVVLEWDQREDRFKLNNSGTKNDRKRSRRRWRGSNKEDVKGKGKAQGDDEPQETIVSTEYLQTLDPTLAPYPSPTSPEYVKWIGLSRYVSRKTIERVVGVEGGRGGIAMVDALMEGWRERGELNQAKMGIERENREGKEGEKKKTFWGKERPLDEENTIEEITDDEEEEEEGLEFVKFDDKRSWPRGSVGSELTKWSKDKSWQLSQIVKDQLNGDAQELLAELQLSFILFTLVYNFSSMSSYKSIFQLICRSSLLCHPSSNRPSATTTTPTSKQEQQRIEEELLSSQISLPMFTTFLEIIHYQFEFLEPNFFATQLPSLERHLLESLEFLRTSLSDSSLEWSTIVINYDESKLEDSDTSSTMRMTVDQVWKELIKRWNGLMNLTMEKFGWELGMIEGTRSPYQQQQQRQQSTTTGSKEKEKKGKIEGMSSKWDDSDSEEEEEGRKVEEAEENLSIPFEDLEEGEDAPVIVDLEGYTSG